MGDRCLFQVVKTYKSEVGDLTVFSPVIYCHGAGKNAIEICKRLQTRMVGRTGDLQYTAARLVQEAIDGDTGNLSFGIWNSTGVLTPEDSHGDAGIVYVNVSTDTMAFKPIAGYLTPKDFIDEGLEVF